MAAVIGAEMISLTQLAKTSEFRQSCDAVYGLPVTSKLQSPIRCVPKTKQHRLTGMAFSYLYRFMLAHHYGLSMSSCVALKYGRDDAAIALANKVMSKHVGVEDAIGLSILLAYLDYTARNGVDVVFVKRLQSREGDIALDELADDLYSMINLLLCQRPAAHDVFINYHFGGETGIAADNSVVMDGYLVRTTTTQFPNLTHDLWHQMCGYHSLALGAGGVFSDGKYVPLTPKGFIVYFARFGKSIRVDLPTTGVELCPNY